MKISADRKLSDVNLQKCGGNLMQVNNDDKFNGKVINDDFAKEYGSTSVED